MVGEPSGALGKTIEVWRSPLGAAVAAKGMTVEAVEQDDNDVVGTSLSIHVLVALLENAKFVDGNVAAH